MNDIERSAAAATETKHRDKTDNQLSATQLDNKDIDKLGRQRPEVFKNALSEIGFCASILLSNILAEFMTSGFNVLLPNLIDDLGFPAEDRTWPSSAFSLVTGSFILSFGRLSDMYGGYIVFLCGNVCMAVWSLMGGFTKNYMMLVFCRALQGLGAAAFLPSGITLLGCVYRPGPRKNLVFSLYGGCAPFGFFSGIFFAGLSGQFFHWSWFFWIGCILQSVVCVLIYLCVPRQIHKAQMPMDWWGSATVIPGLMLLVYAITDSPHVIRGWASPKILVPFILGVLLLGCFVYVEGWVSKAPLLPASIFAPKYTKALFSCLFLVYGCFGIYLLYASFYIETILNIQPLLAAAWFAPLATGGVVIAIVGGVTLHRLSGTFLILLSAVGFLVCVLLFAIMPDNPNYWAWVFPAMVCATIGIDIMYNVSSIFITASVPKHQQGIAGACINGLIFLGMSFFLGWADLAVSMHSARGLKESYKVAFELGIGCAGAAILLIIFGVRIDKAKSDLTLEEREQSGEGLSS